MLTQSEAIRVSLACGSTDLRKSIDGLAALVSPQSDLGTPVLVLTLFSNRLFVFCSRDRDKLKILVWDPNGCGLYCRRLQRGRFRWPQPPASQTLSVNRRQLQWLLDGLTLTQQQAHAPVTARTAV